MFLPLASYDSHQTIHIHVIHLVIFTQCRGLEWKVIGDRTRNPEAQGLCATESRQDVRTPELTWGQGGGHPSADQVLSLREEILGLAGSV